MTLDPHENLIGILEIINSKDDEKLVEIPCNRQRFLAKENKILLAP